MIRHTCSSCLARPGGRGEWGPSFAAAAAVSFAAVSFASVSFASVSFAAVSFASVSFASVSSSALLIFLRLHLFVRGVMGCLLSF